MFGIYRGRRLVLYILLAIIIATLVGYSTCLLYTSPSPRDS